MNVHALAIVRGCDVLPKNLHTRDSADVTGRYICEDYRARDLESVRVCFRRPRVDLLSGHTSVKVISKTSRNIKI